MSRRNKIIIITVIAIIILALIIWLLWLYFNRQPAEVPADPSAVSIPVVLPQASAGDPEANLAPAEKNLRTEVRSIALQFTSRYGSYSSQGNFANLGDLRSLMTEKLAIATDNYITAQKNLDQSDQDYFGVTTVALTADIASLDEASGRAVVLVNTQRQETRGTTVNPLVSYQKIQLELVQTSSGWKVDEAVWQE